MTDVWFYHLQRETLEGALPPLLQKTLERGWRAVVQASSPDRVEALDAHLWTYRQDGFLPHGRKADGFAERQPVYLTNEAENPNRSNALFLVDGASPADWAGGDLNGYDRVILLFDGKDEVALGDARRHWTKAKGAGHAVTYWRQSDAGKWEKQA